MKETTQEQRIRARMQPGIITLNGFLGKDKRSLSDIISDDDKQLQALSRTPIEIAERMQYFSNASFSAFDCKITVDEIYVVETEVTRGRMTCPWAHDGFHRKYITKLTNTKNNTSVVWTALNIHLIKEHGFFEGKGSTFRLDPATLVKALF
jgi:hypothetical protein